MYVYLVRCTHEGASRRRRQALIWNIFGGFGCALIADPPDPICTPNSVAVMSALGVALGVAWG